MINNFELRKVFDRYKEISKLAIERGDHYRVDRSNACNYFALHQNWLSKIGSYFHEVHKQNDKVIHLDICGRATAKSFGADESYCFSLKASEIKRAFAKEDSFLIDGDLFDSNDFSNFIKNFQNKKNAPSLVTFYPMAGLQAYDSIFNEEISPLFEKVTYSILEKRLENIIKVLRPGGYISLERPFQSIGIRDFIHGKTQNNWDISLHMKKLARKCKCRIEIKSEIGGPYFLINKPDLNKYAS